MRKKHADLVTRKLKRRLCGDLPRALSTNRILPLGSLKKTGIQYLFSGWIRKFRGKGRTFTKKFATEVCANLRYDLGLERDPPENEITRMQTLLKQARKLGLSKPKQNMDNVETQEHLPCVL